MGRDKRRRQESFQFARYTGGAIKAATPIAKARKSELVIHNRENKIRDKDSYGNDPHPPIDQNH